MNTAQEKQATEQDAQGQSPVKTNKQTRVDTIKQCEHCGKPRRSLIRCGHCGDRLHDTTHLSPYQRLGIEPKPLYHQDELLVIKEELLDQLHQLKSSRLSSKWALRQRSLVKRDCQRLSLLSGALKAFLEEIIRQGISEDPQSHLELWDSDGLDPRINLLDRAFHELRDMDGYQERERLLNAVSRELNQRAKVLGDQLVQVSLTRDDIFRLQMVISELAQTERWLDLKRTGRSYVEMGGKR